MDQEPKRPKMSREELLKELRSWGGDKQDFEIAHFHADTLLIAYLDDDEITEAWNDIGKWYS